jgi:hypothetical protein
MFAKPRWSSFYAIGNASLEQRQKGRSDWFERYALARGKNPALKPQENPL